MNLRSKVLAVGCSILLASITIAAQSAKLSVPVLGYILNGQEGRLRPLQGILGNSMVGDPVDVGFTITEALALDGRHFLASPAGGKEIALVDLQSGSPSVRAIASAPADFSLAARSRLGSSAALYYADQTSVLVITGLPLHPAITQRIDISGFNAPLVRMAVSDDGNLLICATAETDDHGVYAWSPSVGFWLLTAATDVSDIALTGSGDVIIADAGADEVFSIEDPRGLASRRFLLDKSDGVSKPAGLMVAPTNQIYIANGGSRSIMTIDGTGHLLRTQQCDCNPSGLYPLRDSVYRLSDRADQTIFLLEAGRTHDRVLFVPALRTHD